ncbi:MAG: hypothetical protein ACO1RT_06170 [Planctomycetaceae bacterium]
MILDAMQWPAMTATLVAAWLVGSRKPTRRRWGFGFFIFSNLLWVIWGWQAQAYALIVLQVGLFLLNARGLEKNQPEPDREFSL